MKDHNGSEDTPIRLDTRALTALVEDIDTAEIHGTPDPVESVDALMRMKARIVHLVIGLFKRGYLDCALPVSLETQPALHLAERLRRLLKLQIMTATLTDSIIPKIRRRISFVSERTTETQRYRIRGALDPIKTLKANTYMSTTPVLTNLVGRRPVRDFHTPENLLTVYTLLRVKDDADHLLDDPSIASHMDRRERQILHGIRRKCRFALRTGIFARLIPEVSQIQYGASARSEIDRLIGQAYERVGRMRGFQEGYRALLTWQEDYATDNISTPGTAYTAPFREITPDRAYELLALLEVLLCIGKNGRIRQRETRSGRTTQPAFECRFKDGDRWEIFVQTALPLRDVRYFPHLVGIPDIIIRNPATGRILICDAKQYTISSYGVAFYKMMGYLYQFGYPDAFSKVAGGVLFVPKNIGQEPGWTIWAGTGAPDRQALATLTIPADGAVTEETQRSCERFIIFARQVLKINSIG